MWLCWWFDSWFWVVVLRCLVSLSVLILVICICLLVGAIVFPGFADFLWCWYNITSWGVGWACGVRLPVGCCFGWFSGADVLSLSSGYGIACGFVGFLGLGLFGIV